MGMYLVAGFIFATLIALLILRKTPLGKSLRDEFGIL